MPRQQLKRNLLLDKPESWRLWHPIDPTRPDAALAELPRIGPRTLVWLNEAQFYLAGTEASVQASVFRGRDGGHRPAIVSSTSYSGRTHENARGALPTAGITFVIPGTTAVGK